jgi:hypothetical protein
MGGFGSGRRASGRDTVESCYSLDVHQLHKTGCLQPGWSGVAEWMRDGERVAFIWLRAEADGLHLSYRTRPPNGEWKEVAEHVRSVRVACQFGGSRPYFICPGVLNAAACGRRVAKLYELGGYFRCRQCHRLTHSSQGEGKKDRAVRRADKIKIRLGGKPGIREPIPKRPLNMRQSTYQRLCSKAFDAEMTAYEIQITRLDALLNKWEFRW